MSEQLLIYLPQFHVIVCRECQYAINKRGVNKHFRRLYQHIDIRVRNQLNDYVQKFDVWEVEQVETPTEEVEIIKGLKVLAGFICTVEGCNNKRTTLKSITEHCRDKHGWIKSNGNIYLFIILINY
jgi:hypothetical protein